jgi:tRNA pseudouridine55 synthase
LPVCLGQGTRVIEFLVDSTKAYLAEIEFGIATDTYDASGKIIQKGDPSGISRDKLESMLTSFCGLIQQTPPMFSAVNYKGKRLYKLARAGITVERKSRPAKIHSLQLIGWQSPVATVEVVCGKGTYIRSLADDLGQALGCGACLKSLVRLRCGPFDIKDAVTAPQLEDAFRFDYWQDLVYPIDSVLLDMPAIVVSDDDRWNIMNGRTFVLGKDDWDKASGCLEQGIPVVSPRNRCRAYALDGCFLGVLRLATGKGFLKPTSPK